MCRVLLEFYSNPSVHWHTHTQSIAPTASDKPFPQVAPEVSVTDSHLEHMEETESEMDGQEVKQGHQTEEEEHHAAESFYAFGDLQFLEQKQLMVRSWLKCYVTMPTRGI